ncbi:UDP binding domain-containing protein [Chloroflexota bacterium]
MSKILRMLCFGSDDVDVVKGTLTASWLTHSENVRTPENQLRRITGAPFTTLMNYDRAILNVADMRESISLKLIQLLGEKRVEVEYHDSYIQKMKLNLDTLVSVVLIDERPSRADCLAVVAAHVYYGREKIGISYKLVFNNRVLPEANLAAIPSGWGSRSP